MSISYRSGQAPSRRPNYSQAFKRQLAERACDENVSVAQLALEHALNTNMVFHGAANCGPPSE